MKQVLVESRVSGTLLEAGDAVGLECRAGTDPVGERLRWREVVLGEEIGVDPQRPGEGRADRERGELAARRGQSGWADRGDLRLPVAAERFGDDGSEVDRGSLVRTDGTDSAAGCHIEDIRTDG